MSGCFCGTRIVIELGNSGIICTLHFSLDVRKTFSVTKMSAESSYLKDNVDRLTYNS